MTKARATVAVLAAALALAAVAGGPAFASAEAARGTTLHYTLRFSPLTIVDVGSKGPGLGDEIVANDQVYTVAGKRVGYDANSCVLTSMKPLRSSCSIVFAIPGGTIAGQYIGAPPARKLVAITGGTGRYAGARGTIVVVESGRDRSSKNTLTIELLP